ncbi:TetR/AcrR family transcriptional regulator [Geomicrobium sediminis]|uniref:AcrR family transcriptional regulator n=1 Tax=Geomicrobium sediminis TaxID=1347788 RepID=A0ABS2P7F6_9BACL|nr:TetR family transcriptional regulator [Geomicrobium sediminis]MBM7631217.1 AcrR family transcriptional regulator [Geomicrobium sediminis]
MPKRVDHQKRKQIIAKAAMKLIEQKGAEATTLRDIAKEVGLSLGSIQYYFPKQSDLYRYTMETLFQRTKQRMDEVEPKGTSAFDYAVQMIVQYIQVGDQEQRMENAIWIQFAVMEQEENKELYQRFTTIYREFLETVFVQLQKGDCLKEGLDLDLEIKKLEIYTDGLILNAISKLRGFSQTEIGTYVRHYLAHICR